jgi:putative nucleotidyltransferase with HDIG domain
VTALERLRAALTRLAAGPVGVGAVLLIAGLAVGLLVIDYGGTAAERLAIGDVAPRTLRAPRSFLFEDLAATEARRAEARAEVRPVFVHRADALERQRAAIAAAFDGGRAELMAAVGEHLPEDGALERDVASLPPAVRAGLRDAFRARLGVHLPDADVAALAASHFSEEAAAFAGTLLGDVDDRLVLASRDVLPRDRGAILVLGPDGASERMVLDLDAVATPDEIRREIDVRKAIRDVDAPWTDAAAAVARALVAPNLEPDPARTAQRRQDAADAVAPVVTLVKKGTFVLREGDEITPDAHARYVAMQQAAGRALGLSLLSVLFFVGLVAFALIYFARYNLRRFSLSARDATAVAALVVLVAALTRIGVALGPGVAELVGYGCEPRSAWFLVPVAGVAMLVRLLVGVSWAMVTSVLAAAIFGLVMQLDGLMVLYALASSVVAAGTVDHTRERLAVLRAGLVVGATNAALAVVIHFLTFALGREDMASALTLQPLWALAFGFSGGLLSGFMVLALMPLFERVGFVTDYRLLELANLNHPLMKQLMLRAPGSYHHSVVVGSLAEAACEAVGANALQTRVAAYFHDIGKALKPQYYVENQGSQGNRHAGLDPYTSARIIISHVTDGAELARRHRLPKPCIDNIYMHHGTGLLQYFYVKAQAQADGAPVDEAAFRYPGPRPDSREAGILMLADKVEAATRTIKEPTEEKFRSMIHAIINSVMADDQLADCPLTFKDLYAITDAFVGVLLGIHHQRIEYPQTAHLSARRHDVPPPPRGHDIITLEIPTAEQLRQPSPLPAERADDAPLGDYEAVEHLPRGTDAP